MDANPDAYVTKFQQSVGRKIILALPKKAKHLAILCEKYHFDIPHQIVNGGESRFHSVQNALKNKKSIVAIHDGVRPLVSKTVIKNCIESAEKFGATIPILPMQDISEKSLTTEIKLDRSQFV